MWVLIWRRCLYQCASTLSAPTSKPSSECASSCAASTDKCGGDWRINVYTYATPGAVSDDWTYQGCIQDSPTRILSYSTNSDSMTSTMCLSSCSFKGYAYGGVQAGNECWCGASLGFTAKSVDGSLCNSGCKGGGTGCG
jgi:hypothetical protein